MDASSGHTCIEVRPPDKSPIGLTYSSIEPRLFY